ncbi:MAG: hypothetical protein FWE09_05025 [Treponema sp.]|nr:hypothetical protein [Treponema sp.]
MRKKLCLIALAALLGLASCASGPVAKPEPGVFTITGLEDHDGKYALLVGMIGFMELFEEITEDMTEEMIEKMVEKIAREMDVRVLVGIDGFDFLSGVMTLPKIEGGKTGVFMWAFAEDVFLDRWYGDAQKAIVGILLVDRGTIGPDNYDLLDASFSALNAGNFDIENFNIEDFYTSQLIIFLDVSFENGSATQRFEDRLIPGVSDNIFSSMP